jgi:hypothetical protein
MKNHSCSSQQLGILSGDLEWEYQGNNYKSDQNLIGITGY